MGEDIGEKSEEEKDGRFVVMSPDGFPIERDGEYKNKILQYPSRT